MNVEEIKSKYQNGMRVELVEMADEPQMIEGLQGTVQFVDDLGQVHIAWDNGSSLALNPEEDQFNLLEQSEKIRILLIKPNEYPKVVEIEDSLEEMQRIVGGYIEEYMPFDDEVALVCNEEGKLNGLELNRAIYNDNKEVVDIIAGDFFLCYAPIDSEKFLSLPKELEEKYRQKFKFPEHFYMKPDGIVARSYKPLSKEKER